MRSRLLEPAAALSFRNQLRSDRAEVSADAEAYQALLTTIESLGAHLSNDHRAMGLKAYSTALKELVSRGGVEAWLPEFDGLLRAVRDSRNDLMHEGAAARRTASQVVELALILEDALVLEGELRLVEHCMVQGPTCAEPWQTLKLIRRVMLSNQFSFLPVRMGPEGPWRLVSDIELVRYLRGEVPPPSRTSRKKLLYQKLTDAVAATPALQLRAATVLPVGTAADTIDFENDSPALVADEAGNLRGIIAAFDLL